MIRILAAIIGVFVLGLLVQRVMRARFCALCVAVSLSWIGLLTLRTLGYAIDTVAFSLLLGASAVGILYLIEHKLRSSFWLLPSLLTLLLLAYALVTVTFPVQTAVLVLGTWFAFVIVYLARHGSTGAWFKRITECCRRW